jgi:hypothetical protein
LSFQAPSQLNRLVDSNGRRLAEAAALILILASALYVYRGAFSGFFVQDDYGWLASSRFRTLGEYLPVFLRFNAALTYRPLSQETFFFLGQKIFGLWPPGFHSISVCFHLLSIILVYLLARKFCPVLPSLVGSFFFAVHSAHFRSIYWISAIPEPMALTFMLLSFLFFIRFDRKNDRAAWILSVASMGVAMMSKESALALPLVLAAYCLFFSRARVPWTLPFFGISGFYTVLRLVSIPIAQYPLVFGRELVGNAAAYLAWAAGFTQTLLGIKMGREAQASYPAVAIAFVIVIAVMLLLSRDKRVGFFSLTWFVIALQPVLYFWQHIDSYYLAPALSALALFIASALPRPSGLRNWRALFPACAIVGYALWFAPASVRLEGKWWNERAHTGKHILDLMRQVENWLPGGQIAYVFGFTESDFGVLQKDAAFKAFGYPPKKYLLIGLNPDTPGQIRTLAKSGSIRASCCLLYSHGQMFNVTREFRRQPLDFLSPVSLAKIAERISPGPLQAGGQAGLLVSPTEIHRGRDRMTLKVANLDAARIDLMYTLDGRKMPPVMNWQLDSDHEASLFVDRSTPPGVYHFLAVRNSADPDPGLWCPVDVSVTVR